VSGHPDVWLIKTDSNGNEEWDTTFTGEYLYYGESVAVTSDGGYILAATAYIPAADFLLIKTDSGGNEEWNKTFGGTSSDFPKLALETSDGGYMIMGNTNSFGAGGSDVWLIKTDSEGNIE
jgi:hypothetical protein